MDKNSEPANIWRRMMTATARRRYVCVGIDVYSYAQNLNVKVTDA